MAWKGSTAITTLLLGLVGCAASSTDKTTALVPPPLTQEAVEYLERSQEYDDRFLNGRSDLALDLNADGVNDFIFEYSGVHVSGEGPTWTLRLRPLNTNMVQPYGFAGVYPLAGGEIIDLGLAWSNKSAMLIRMEANRHIWDESWYGNIANVDDGFLGVRLNVDENAYFGWIRVACRRWTGEFEVLGWALAGGPNAGIAAGQKQHVD